ncbi:unnamed protein product [Trichogramma brassicae]|uniref:Uncharacterized protein n=1 Tax=Trichogramma brassicae TaxID=86971 RepID=A0A6H5J454_9HYME|nr:unnamed protein product [Trichogramma brassicae]
MVVGSHRVGLRPVEHLSPRANGAQPLRLFSAAIGRSFSAGRGVGGVASLQLRRFAARGFARTVSVARRRERDRKSAIYATHGRNTSCCLQSAAAAAALAAAAVRRYGGGDDENGALCVLQTVRASVSVKASQSQTGAQPCTACGRCSGSHRRFAFPLRPIFCL